MHEKNNNRRRLLLVAAVFILPVLLAKVALETEFFNRGATNKGELLAPGLSLSEVYQAKEQKWRLLYVLPQQCEKSCENALYSLNQVWLALGKHMDRVQPVVLNGLADQSASNAKVALPNSLKSYDNLEMLTVSQQSVNKVFKDVGADGIFIVDTLDNIILRYPLQQKQQQAVLHSREILADLRKLLKLSRIG